MEFDTESLIMDRECDEIFERMSIREKSDNIITDEERKMVLKKSYLKAAEKFYTMAFTRQMVQDFMVEGKRPFQELENGEQHRLLTKAVNSIAIKGEYCFMTINVYPHITLDSLQCKVEKFVKRKGIVKSYFYVYEVRKEDNGNFDGLHCHLLFYRKCKPNDVKRGAQSTFKDTCNTTHPEILNIKYISEELAIEKIEYMMGQKKESKQKGVEATERYRHEYNLEPFYESTPTLPCRGAEEITD